MQRLPVDADITAQHKSIDAIAGPLELVACLEAGIQVAEVKPGILVDPHPFIIGIGRQNLLQPVAAQRRIERQLVIARRHVAFVGENPDLQELDQLGFILVVFTVRDTAAGTHHLYVAVADYRHVAHAVAMLEVSLQRDADDLHVVMRVGTKTHARLYRVIVEYPQHTKVHALRIVVVGKTERMITFEPAVVGFAARISAVQDTVVHNAGIGIGDMVKADNLLVGPLTRFFFVSSCGRYAAGSQCAGAQQPFFQKLLAIHSSSFVW